MTVFKVQCILAAVSGYDNVQSFSPDYIWSIANVWRRWYFPWPRIEVGVVKNLRAAELKAVRLAIHQAKIRLKKERVRVLRVTQLDGKESKIVVWDNGKYLDTTILPWYWRLLRWVVTPRKKHGSKTDAATCTPGGEKAPRGPADKR